MGMTYLQEPHFITSVLLNQYINTSITRAPAEKPKKRKTSLWHITFLGAPFPQSRGH